MQPNLTEFRLLVDDSHFTGYLMSHGIPVGCLFTFPLILKQSNHENI